MTNPVGPPTAEPEASGAALSGSAVLAGSGVAALLAFMLQNRDDVTLTFLLWDFTWPVWLLTLASALVGAVVWLGLGILRRHRRRVARRADRR
ncbi:lipopolysaccharide assembly protein LapA domain-containing protein [Aquipuribacter sp. MA13-6]|uniref:lipopolysaccharide assembly protein LapA domain-containing protein n=1 Tax=unclassified Aquipuribacter TaxID=2635084 RepID=UPI003EE977A8